MSSTAAQNDDTSKRPTKVKTHRKACVKTPEDYANVATKLAHLSKASSRTTANYGPLAEFLNRAPSISPSKECYDDGDDEIDPVTVYTYKSNGAPVLPVQVRRKDCLEQDVCSAWTEEDTGRLIFLRGYQEPECLNLLGARYQIDHEFFRRHVDVNSDDGTSNLFATPSLPSAFENMFSLSVTTIGCRQSAVSMNRSGSKDVAHLRQHGGTKMQNYMRALVRGQDNKIISGQPFLRSFNIHDEQYFSLEQELSVYVAQQDGKWIVVIWSDIGNLPRDKLAEALQCNRHTAYMIQCLPIIQHPSRPISNFRQRLKPSQFCEPLEKDMVLQNMSLLPFNYGQTLDPTTMSFDIFYLLNELFRISLSSEQQFLAMLEDCLTRELAAVINSHESNQKMMMLSNIEYNKQSLNRHIRKIEFICSYIETRQDLKWPTVSSETHPEQAEISSDEAKRLLKDYERLLQISRALLQSFDSGMNMLVNRAMIDESQRAIMEAERVTKLTSLAFFFIPLSFTASVFGMNFKEFANENGNRLHIWIWIVVSVVILAVSYAFLRWETWRLKERVLFLLRKWRTDRSHDQRQHV